jgi:hypothetical protein
VPDAAYCTDQGSGNEICNVGTFSDPDWLPPYYCSIVCTSTDDCPDGTDCVEVVTGTSVCYGYAAADTDTDTDSDADEDAGPDTDVDACVTGGNWHDDSSGLCWQNPPATGSYNWGDAAAYCDGLSLGGLDNWRLPMIQEQVSLVRGCVDGAETGDPSLSGCGISDPDCLEGSCNDSSCATCDYLAGPGDPGGCYWDSALGVDCVCWYWSSSPYTDSSTAKWVVDFSYAVFGGTGPSSSAAVRCVLGGI